MQNQEIYQEETIDIKEIFFKALRHWEYFLVGILLAMGIAFFVNKIQKPRYQVSTTIQINENKSSFDPQALLGMDFSNQRNKIYNEIELLQSYSLLSLSVGKLNLETTYYLEGKYTNEELYKTSPFTIMLDKNHAQPIDYFFEASFISKDSVEINIYDEWVEMYDYKQNRTLPHSNLSAKSFTLGNNDSIETKNYKFELRLNPFFQNKDLTNDTYLFCFNSQQAQVKQFSDISFEVLDKSSVIKVSLTHGNLLKSVDFLNTLSEEFLSKELVRKNIVNQKTLSFIDTHLEEINDSLFASEKRLQEYQSNHSALNMEFQSQAMLENLEKFQTQKSEVIIQQKYYRYLSESLKKNDPVEELIAPSVMNIDNPILNTQISNLITLQSELSNIQLGMDKTNPYMNSLLSRIDNSKKVILEYVQNENENLNLVNAELDERINKVLGKINLIPQTQRELFGYERSFKLYDNIYTFLLQKRSETLLARASTVPLNEIIDKAGMNNFKLQGNNQKLNYLIALILGLLIPGALIYIRYYFNSKIISDTDIETENNLPILGHIIKQKQDDVELVFSNPKAPITESFRMLRTNLEFARKSSDSQVILISSTMQGEGKSFIANNLAQSLAINDKNTILLMFDLRKPKLYLNMPTHKAGISNFLIGQNSLDEIIQTTDLSKLSVITAGTIPPNPSELIASKQTEKLFQELREKYDYIIVDTPPMGIVSEGFLLTKHSDINLCVVRYNYTPLKSYQHLIKELRTKGINNLNTVGNCMENKKTYGYNYSYNYEY